ncbi:nuclear transport factor 2 family protein [Pseudonocardia hispaniensis]|uniref:Nuclear transport factor 2 family protein n=1 Tax=Pseudonocardia hispaniensis TaxID=904933 RepID=A0ABW1J666_9PSEU
MGVRLRLGGSPARSTGPDVLLRQARDVLRHEREVLGEPRRGRETEAEHACRQRLVDQVDRALAGPAEVFEELARRLAAREWDDAAELYAADVEITNRFSPDGPITSRGRDAVREFFTGLGGRLDSLTVIDAALTPGADPEMLTAEFSFAATAGGGGVHFSLPAVFVMRVRNGEIVASRDYIGPRQV